MFRRTIAYSWFLGCFSELHMADVAVAAAEAKQQSPDGAKWLVCLSAPAIFGPLWVQPWRDPSAITAFETLTGFLLALLLTITTITDIGWRRIPNWTTYPTILWAWLANTVMTISGSEAICAWLGGIGLKWSLAGTGACFGLLFLLFSITGRGAGDVKLAAAFGSLLGPEPGVFAVIYGFIFAGVAAVVIAVWQHGPVMIVSGVLRGLGSWLFPLWVSGPDESHRQLMHSTMPLAPFLQSAQSWFFWVCESKNWN